MSKTGGLSTRSRADSPAPRIAVSKVDEPLKQQTPSEPVKQQTPSKPRSFAISMPDKKDLTTLAALITSAVLAYGQSRALVSAANTCWQEEGAIIFCAKFVAYAVPFVGCFGAVVHLWLTAIEKVTKADTWSDYGKAVFTVMLSVWIVCFGEAVLRYSEPKSSMTAKDMYICWLQLTLLAISGLGCSVAGVLLSVMAWRAYSGGHYLKTVAPAISSLVTYGLGYSIIHCLLTDSGTSTMDVLLFSGKCIGIALVVVGILAAMVLLCVQGVRALDQSKYIETLWTVAVSALIMTTACLAINCASAEPGFSKTDFLRLWANGGAIIFGCAVLGSALIFLWRQWGPSQKDD